MKGGLPLKRHLGPDTHLGVVVNFRKTREGWNCRFQKTPRTEGGDKVPAVSTQGSGFPAGLLFPVPEILEFVAFCDSSNFSSNFPGTFPEFSRRTPEQTAETATAFSSFLTIQQ